MYKYMSVMLGCLWTLPYFIWFVF